MKSEIKNHIKFKIGEEHFDREFSLITKGIYNGKKYSYDIYEFEREKGDSLFDLKINKILLYYNADILVKVEYFFNKKNFDKLIEKIDSIIDNKPKQVNKDNYTFYFWWIAKYFLILRKDKQEYYITLSYQKRKYM